MPSHHSHHHHQLLQHHKPKPKAPTAADTAAQQLIEQVAAWAARWEVQAAAAGRADAAAMTCAARSLQQLSSQLAQHRSLVSKRGDVRAQLQKHAPPALLTHLLLGASSSDSLVTLQALAVFARCMPALLPAGAFAPRLLQLLCGSCQRASDGAAKVLLLQLSTWRCSEVWPHWTAAGATACLFEQLSGLCAASESGGGRGVDSSSGVSQLALLARLAELSEQQVVQQLAGSTQLAREWLQLLLRLGRLHDSLAGSAAALQLQDSVCLLLAALSRAPGTAPLELAAADAQLLPLLRHVLHRPTQLAAEVPKCWTHAAQAASLPALWQQQPQPAAAAAAGAAPDGCLAAHERAQLLTDIAAAAACAFYVSSPQNSQLAATNASAAGLLAAALLPAPGCMFGSRRPCASQFLTAILSSDNCHVLLHSLASCADDASNSNTTAWRVLRLVCSQLGSAADGGSDAAAAAAARPTGSHRSSSDGIQAEQLHRVVQAYSSYVRTGVNTLCLLGSLHVLLCQAALAVGQQQQQQQQQQREREQEPHHGRHAGGDTCRSAATGDQLLRAADMLLERLLGHAAHAGSIGGGGGGDARQLSWQLLAAVYSALAVAVQLCEQHAAALSGHMSAVALTAISLAASALRVLLPLPGRADSQQGAGMQQQGPPDGTLECCLAAVKVMALLGRMAREGVPMMLASVEHPEHPGGLSVHSARAAAAHARAALDPGLQRLLSGLVAAVGASSEEHDGAAGSSSSSSNSSHRSASLEATLQHNAQQELGAWAAVALAVCYGQFGASGWQGAALADYRQQGALFADVVVQLGSDLQLPAHAHAALLAAGSPVLKQQLLQARACAGAGADDGNGSSSGSSSSPPLVLKFSASLQAAPVQLVCDFLYTGQAQVPSSGLVAQLPLCADGLEAAAAVAAGHASPAQQRALLDQQQTLVQQLRDQQQSVREQLSVLGLLAKRLQLPLLAALCRDSLPLPGQQLPVLHPRLAALLPQRLLLLLAGASDGGPEQQQQHQDQEQALCSPPAGRHQPCTAYLQLLAQQPAAAPPQAAQQHVQDQQLSDVWLMVPALVAAPAAAGDAPQQLQEQQQAVAVTALLPAHRAVLAAGCPYFEALLSQRWATQDGHAAHVLAVPEADVHVAAALLAFLCTGTLHVALPGEVCMLPASPAAAPDGQTGTAEQGSAGGTPSKQQSSVLSWGCCAPCHRSRTLLRLWRCAELLLLPELQTLCLAAVDAAACELRSECCLALLDDCWQLGAAAAADAIAASLVARADEAAVACLPEWAALEPSMRDSLARSWAEQQQAREDGELLRLEAAAAAAAAAAPAAGMQPSAPLGARVASASPLMGQPGGLGREHSRQREEGAGADRHGTLLQAAGALHRLLRPVLATAPAGGV